MRHSIVISSELWYKIVDAFYKETGKRLSLYNFNLTDDHWQKWLNEQEIFVRRKMVKRIFINGEKITTFRYTLEADTEEKITATILKYS